LPRQKLNETFSDTTILCYKRQLAGYDLSLSMQMDSLKQIKLATVRIAFKGNPSGSTPYYRSARYIQYEMIVAPVPDEVRLHDLIHHFQKEINHKKL
jgi:hypothetical protein